VTIGPLRATDVPLHEFNAVDRDDRRFVDTTHAARIAGDVNGIVLDVLPVLAPGVVAHVHDVFFPFEYPGELLQRRCCPAEQYLLRAFLWLNPSFELRLGAQALSKVHPARLREMVPSLTSAVSPASFYMRRTS
jgi:hypothetical protein